MSFDPSFNSGQASDLMSSVTPDCLTFSDFQGLDDNEDNIDLTNLINDSVGDEDLFKIFENSPSLNFFSESPSLKPEPCNTPLIPSNNDCYSSHQQSSFDSYREEQQFLSAPPSVCTSACSSAAPSPVPFLHTTPFHQTPPLTPPTDKSLLRQHLQINGPTPPAPVKTMSSTPYHPADATQPQQRYEAQHNMNMNLEMNMQHKNQTPTSIGGSAAAESTMAHGNFTPIKQEANVDMDMPLALTTDRTKQPLSSNLNMSNKRTAVSQSAEPRTKKSKTVTKGTPEYIQKRERNNVAVRRSRDKAKRKALETQEKVQMLTEENKHLKEEVKKLSSEVSTLKNLLQNITSYPNVKS